MLLRVFVLREEINSRSLYSFLKANWRALADAGRPLQVTVQEYKAKRSTDQNRLYWQILNDITEQAWVYGKKFSAEAWHEFFKRQFIGHEELPNGGTVGISTTSLSVSEFSDYILKIEAYASNDLGVNLS